MEDEQNLYLKTAVLAGEILIKSNAEAYRVEDTVRHILNRADFNSCNVVALTTGLYTTVEVNDNEPVTMIRRISSRSVNLYRIARVNDVSREIVSGTTDIKDAYEKLINLKSSEYAPYTKDIAGFLFILMIVLLFNGSFTDVLMNIPAAVTVTIISNICSKYNTNAFVADFISGFLVAVIVTAINALIPLTIAADILIIACIMPLVPGTALTNGVRDIFRGDYTSGFAKLLEAIMIALFIALGIGSGLLLVQEVLGWIL
ncbi:MAG TPA: threonine/serine exporter family protein [Erysipelotrichaceae bacterium]|nr:threonine/serine exporter family protein [Erysipelotrichaceae bacterium]